MSTMVTCKASPSLALIKYWGKQDSAENLPATSSLAVTLGGAETVTQVMLSERDDRLILEGKAQKSDRIADFFQHLRGHLGTTARFHAESHNTFPSSAGLASSSSGFAALTCACARAVGRDMSNRELSELARLGSASAARSIFGGFVLLPAGARFAQPLLPPSHWEELRILVVIVTRKEKSIPSREAMERTRTSSPFYSSWLDASASLLDPALEALRERDLERLGHLSRLSYLRMHATMLASDPAILYWLPSTLSVIRECATMRDQGIGAWETIDAGPQVKILCEVSDVERIESHIEQLNPELDILRCHPGEGTRCEEAAP